jgi:hypothetical protein
MQKILSQLFVLSCIVGLQVSVMIFGWGLQPKSWWWIVGGGIFGATALRVLASHVDGETTR